ncbi:hypothetical protein BDF21DRAFT_332766 [Thamnidium elegans]|nr:hypothetical protein BDF21DRAFT_332766 [Thamnidium elegans]
MKLYNKIKEQDCVALDGGYTLFIKQFENLCKDKNINLDDKNFFYPIRKENGIALNAQEEHYNKVFGSFRSVVENQFKELYNKFKRFNKFNIITQEHHKLWINENFEFPNELRLIDIVYTNQMEQVKKLNELSKIQKDLLNLSIENNQDSMIIDDENEILNESDKNESDVDFPEYKNPTKKRKKKSKNKDKLDIHNIRNVNKDEGIYEIEYIVTHKIIDKQYTFLVKWKNYDNKENSWVKENDFIERDIIRDYFQKNNILFPNY